MSAVNLTMMKAGTVGTVVRIDGGQALIKRLSDLGIRPGVKIIKKSSQLMRGPVTMAIGNSQVAIGFGMAKKIILETGR
jgi:ferrous iron transport protein A